MTRSPRQIIADLADHLEAMLIASGDATSDDELAMNRTTERLVSEARSLAASPADSLWERPGEEAVAAPMGRAGR